MRTRWCLVVALLCGCARAQHEAQRPLPTNPEPILAAAGDSVLATRGGRLLYVADSATGRALALAAHRAGVRLVPAPAQVWCADEAQSGRAVGSVVALQLDSLWAERAHVRWTATCLMTLHADAIHAAVGEMGVYEVMRHGEGWRVSRALMHFAF